MGEEHFYFLSQPHRDFVLFGFGNIAGNLTGVFMFFTGDFARIRFWVTQGLRRTGLACMFQSLILGNAFS